MKSNIINIFNLLSIKAFNQGFTNISSKSLDFFMSFYKDKLTQDFIWEYVSFQIAYWYNKKTNNKFAVSWVFGEKAIQRWENKPENYLYYTQLFLNKLGIERPVFYYKVNLRIKFEEMRALYFNTDKGFENCSINSFYSNDSKYCEICDFKEICKQI